MPGVNTIDPTYMNTPNALPSGYPSIGTNIPLTNLNYAAAYKFVDPSVTNYKTQFDSGYPSIWRNPIALVRDLDDYEKATLAAALKFYVNNTGLTWNILTQGGSMGGASNSLPVGTNLPIYVDKEYFFIIDNNGNRFNIDKITGNIILPNLTIQSKITTSRQMPVISPTNTLQNWYDNNVNNLVPAVITYPKTTYGTSAPITTDIVAKPDTPVTALNPAPSPYPIAVVAPDTKPVKPNTSIRYDSSSKDTIFTLNNLAEIQTSGGATDITFTSLDITTKSYLVDEAGNRATQAINDTTKCPPDVCELLKNYNGNDTHYFNYDASAGGGSTIILPSSIKNLLVPNKTYTFRIVSSYKSNGNTIYSDTDLLTYTLPSVETQSALDTGLKYKINQAGGAGMIVRPSGTLTASGTPNFSLGTNYTVYIDRIYTYYYIQLMDKSICYLKLDGTINIDGTITTGTFSSTDSFLSINTFSDLLSWYNNYNTNFVSLFIPKATNKYGIQESVLYQQYISILLDPSAFYSAQNVNFTEYYAFPIVEYDGPNNNNVYSANDILLEYYKYLKSNFPDKLETEDTNKILTNLTNYKPFDYFNTLASEITNVNNTGSLTEITAVLANSSENSKTAWNYINTLPAEIKDFIVSNVDTSIDTWQAFSNAVENYNPNPSGNDD